MKKFDAYQWEKEELSTIKAEGKRPSILLHSCCAICNSYPLEYLSEYFEITLLYNNANLYPAIEYDIRLDELRKYVDKFNTRFQKNVVIVPFVVDRDTYHEMYLSKRSEDKEGYGRCRMCYALRMNEAMRYASDHGFDYVSTVMTISRQKNSDFINDIARRLMPAYPNVKYFYSNFKKNRGIDRSVEISKEENMYIQKYCGCLYSYIDAKTKGKDVDHRDYPFDKK
ncbi:MAG: epoxyqueuosine reductase QueH [Erysipelotrichales bacterium]|nr:MAG: epoxyqueuosine reductase QueH [Erysipelotrichales bacterium]